MKSAPLTQPIEFLLPPGGEAGSSRMHLTCIRAVERARVIFVRPGRKQDEGDFTAIFPLTLTLSRRERENNVHYLLVGSVILKNL